MGEKNKTKRGDKNVQFDESGKISHCVRNDIKGGAVEARRCIGDWTVVSGAISVGSDPRSAANGDSQSGWATLQCSAALLKLPVSTIAMKYSN